MSETQLWLWLWATAAVYLALSPQRLWRALGWGALVVVASTLLGIIR